MDGTLLVVVVCLTTFPTAMATRNICTPGLDCRLPEAPLKPFSYTEIPQLVLITVEGMLSPAVSQRLFNANRRNPDDCPVSMTTFLDPASVDIGSAYAEIQRGMEVSLLGDIDFSNVTEKEAYDMILEVKTEMGSTIPHLQKVLGWRSSNSSLAGRKLFNALAYIGFTYDSTLMVNRPVDGRSYQWPFRLSRGWKLPPCDNKGRCDQGDFPNLLQFPVTALYSYNNNVTCYTVTDCIELRAESNMKNLLLSNLKQVYIGNRAPFVIQIDSYWLQSDPALIDSMDEFLKELTSFHDLYIVSIEKAVKWLANPHKVTQLHKFKEWQCPLQKSSFVDEPFKKYPKRPDPYKPEVEEKAAPHQNWNSKSRIEKIKILFAAKGSSSMGVNSLELLVFTAIVIKLFV